MNKPQLTNITIRGFKTLKNLEDFNPGPLTVFVGANGAGKSNFISFFRLLSWAIASSPGNLQRYVGEMGGSSSLLHDGPAITRELEVALSLNTDKGRNDYAFRLVFAAKDTFIYANERFRFSREDQATAASWIDLGAGHREAQILERAGEGDKTARFILGSLQKIKVYQFHNTTSYARIRTRSSVEDGQWLREDGANLAPFLYRLREHEPAYYRRIVETLRLILPFFADFELEPDYGTLLLRWRERGSDLVFDASQAADGMLRAMALVSLLLQPESDLPNVILLDEPELGLHPYAINIIGGLIRSVTNWTQVIAATQSVSLINCFLPEEVVVVDRVDRVSSFRRLSSDELAVWLETYTLSELWEKNLFGGRPGWA